MLDGTPVTFRCGDRCRRATPDGQTLHGLRGARPSDDTLVEVGRFRPSRCRDVRRVARSFRIPVHFRGGTQADVPETRGPRLRVTGSQVQIPSARQRETTGQGPCPERSGAAPDRFWGGLTTFDHHRRTIACRVSCQDARWRRGRSRRSCDEERLRLPVQGLYQQVHRLTGDVEGRRDRRWRRRRQPRSGRKSRRPP
jgi:hypothetical protein